MNVATNSISLELHVPDFGKVKDFYAKLGFEVVWENPPREAKWYLVMRMHGNILCFWPGNEYVWEQPYFKKFPKNTKFGYGVEIAIMTPNIETYYNKVKGFANVVEPLVKQPWGLKDFRIVDPFGYYLRFTEPHNILYEANAVP